MRLSGSGGNVPSAPKASRRSIAEHAARRARINELAAVPGVTGVMMTFDDFVIGMEQFGTRILPLMRCRNPVNKAA